jgi:hypothetical protein
MKWLALVALAGCGSYSTYRTTRIPPAGHTEWLFGLQVAGTSEKGQDDQQAVAPLPEVAIAARRGFADRYEVQVNGTMLPLRQLTTGSLELAGKVRLLESGRWSLAAGAGVGYRLAETGGAYIEGAYASAPLIGAVELGRHQLVLSVVGGYQRWYSSGAHPVGIPFIGDSIGFVWQLGRSWALLPEAGIAWSSTQDAMSDSSRLFHLGIAVLWTR